MFGSIPAALIFSCFYGYRNRALDAQGLRSGAAREAGLIAFVMCFFGVAAMILWPHYRWETKEGILGNLTILSARTDLTDGVNLVPFRLIADYLHRLQRGDWYYGGIFLFGNICMFFPLGFFPPLLFRGQGLKQVFFIGFGYSLTLEVLQFFLGRHCDVDDVILNVFGTLCGFWLYWLLKHLFPSTLKHFQCTEK
ncbi:MAG: VanZ family protein [Oscillospiraceae bacterium]|nr:VanZ family protein [Oscillospiraceae bacterium]